MDFDLGARLREILTADAGTPAPSPSEDPDDHEVSDPSQDGHRDGPSTTLLVNEPFAGFERANIAAALSAAPRAPPTPLHSHIPISSSPPPKISSPKSRAQRRSKEHRRARRGMQQAKTALLYPEGKSLKGSALRQIQNAIALLTDLDMKSAAVQSTDSCSHRACDSPIDTDMSLDMDDVPVASSAYVARLLKQTEADRRPLSRDDVLKLPGFRLIELNRVLLDNQGRAIGLLDGHPNDQSWPAVNKDVAAIIQIIASRYHYRASRKANRRGDFETISCGISYGGGQKRVGNFTMSAYNEGLWRTLLQLRAIRRVTSFVNTSMKIFFPKIHQYYEDTLARICEHNPALKRNYPDNAFAAISLNLGPRAVSFVHTDHLNLAFGLCAITAIGSYDYKKGGHLILWDLGLIIEFPPGCTIIIPSAILRHSNAALAEENERRYALLQYSAGGLFRWADCGFQSQKAFFAAGNTMSQTGRERWEDGVAMFSTWSELQRRGLQARLK